MRRTAVAILICLAACLSIGAAAAPASEPDDLAFFESRVRPLLEAHCLECHSTDTEASGGLVLDSRAGWQRGGDSGPPLVAGRPEESLLLKAVSWTDPGLQMPPKTRLSATDQATLADWIRRGAADPREAAATAAEKPGPKHTAPGVEEGRRFWAFAPRGAPAVPAVRDTSWPWNDVDRFVLARLEAEGLAPAADAEPAAVARRLSYALTGLPPTVERLERFVAACAADGGTHRAAVIADYADELLASTAFAERWAGHWLDIVRFAESSGGGRTLLFKDAWRFRDWVIDAFRENRPLDRMIREQIAGDLMPAASREERARQLVASGFLALGPTIYEEQDKQRLRFDVIDEQLDTIGRAFLGLSIGCARCHDHKFDPLSQRDYYGLAGILASTRTLSNYTDNVVGWISVPLPLDEAEEARFAAAAAESAAAKDRLKAARKELAKLEDKPSDLAGKANRPIPLAAVPGIVIDDAQAEPSGAWKHSTHFKHYFGDGYLHDDNREKGAKTLTFTPRLPTSGRYEVRLAYQGAEGRAKAVPVHIFHALGDVTVTVDQTQPPDIDGRFVSLGTYGFEQDGTAYVIVTNEGTDGYVTADVVQFLPVDAAAGVAGAGEAREAAGRLRAEIGGIEARLKELAAIGESRPVAMAVREEDEIGDTQIRIRGDVRKKGPTVPRGFPAVLAAGARPLPAAASGRLELAEWIVSRDNPLAARVMANRIWTWLTGRGIVPSVDNFGTTGEPPTHPELLEHLARRLEDGRWDVREAIRAVVRSRTWQLAVGVEPRDPDGRLLSRAHRRRLDAEELRDTMLFVSGGLDTAVGGPNIAGAMSAAPDAGEASATEFKYVFTDTRRSLYTPAFRNNRLEIFATFDFGDVNASQGQRPTTTVSTQALYFLNHPFVLEQSRLAARRFLASFPADADAGTGAAAAAGAAADARRLDQAFMAAIGRPPHPAERRACLDVLAAAGADPEPRAEAWSIVFQSLFGSVDFRYLD